MHSKIMSNDIQIDCYCFNSERNKKKGLQRSIRNAPLASEWAGWCACEGQLDRPM